MLLALVVAASERVAATRSRKVKSAALAELLRSLGPDELRIVVPWLAGELRQGRIGVGYALLAVVMGTAAAEAPTLSVAEVDAAWTAIAACAGAGSAKSRKDLLTAVFSRATKAEQRFLGPLLGGELRQGALEGVMAEAVAEASGVSPSAVRRAAMLSGNLVAAALAALEGGEAALEGFRLEVLRPVQPMLAQTADTVGEALASLGSPVRFDVKLDGARIQVHKAGDRVEVWTRALLPCADAVPEVLELVAALPARDVVLDGEVLALRPDGRPYPFQVTMRRFGRKLDVAALRAELPLTPVFFDVLAVDDRSLLDEPLSERVAALERLLPAENRITSLTTSDEAEASAFLTQVLASGHEGLMAKSLDSPYEAGHRGAGWRKIKAAWTLDLVVLAAEWGSGRRRGLLSNLHLGARDPLTGGFVMLGKTFKGLTDEVLAWQTAELLAREEDREDHVVHVRPELVVEIAFNEVQSSPRYPGGVALRFARVKGYRPDKRPEDADTIDAVRRIFSGAAARA